MNGGSEQQFLPPLPGDPLDPRIAADEFQTARKACNLQYKTDFGDSGNHQNQTFPHACPKVVPEGPEVVKGGALGGLWGSLGHPSGPFCVPKTPLGVPLACPGSIWGLTESLWGSPGGVEVSNYINKLPIDRQSGQMLYPYGPLIQLYHECVYISGPYADVLACTYGQELSGYPRRLRPRFFLLCIHHAFGFLSGIGIMRRY